MKSLQKGGELPASPVRRLARIKRHVILFLVDENRPSYQLRAPGPSGSGGAKRLPGRDSFPRLDDRLVEPEVTRDEMVGGRRIVASPAQAPHSIRHTRLDYVIAAHVGAGFVAATDQLTRYDDESDFATDTCIYESGVDAATGGRHLEELAFEVVSTQSLGLLTEKARRMHRRGVRRIFAVFVKGPRQVCEWSAGEDGWRSLAADAVIEDRCLVRPLALSALLDAAAADDAVVEALAAKGNPVLQRREAAARAEGEARGKADAILKVLAARGLSVSAAQRRKILGCRSLEQLNVWFDRSLVAASIREVLAGS